MMQTHESLSQHTTLKVGGPAEYFAVISTREELVAVVTEAKRHSWPIHVIGSGSNILVSDDGVSGVVIKNCIAGVVTEAVDGSVLVQAGAGVVLDELIATSVEQGWWGLENLSHIPGTVGATPVQNVGAYGVEVKDLITEVEVFDTKSMQFRILSNEECQFGYRTSIFKNPAGSSYIITNVTFALSTDPQPRLHYRDLQSEFKGLTPSQQAIREAVIAIRSKKFPNWHEVGTAGSFFKNPIIPRVQYQKLTERYPDLPSFAVSADTVKLPLGWILDRILKLKGEKSGAVATYEGQALVLVNHGGATARDIRTFAKAIEQRVFKELGIVIEWEVTEW